ncbi:hypothetical protein DDZ13_08170 [Coraliomargarita sinensis]|uniref:Uncharacterized protein n=2 Tax=Coraliomargarita sinensis TaxID=2174842 RepID=A0A317ZKY6_9BACT|nr:hypothetical protein DDZ13_08170 [Coraliomargarita sinensis]
MAVPPQTLELLHSFQCVSKNEQANLISAKMRCPDGFDRRWLSPKSPLSLPHHWWRDRGWKFAVWIPTLKKVLKLRLEGPCWLRDELADDDNCNHLLPTNMMNEAWIKLPASKKQKAIIADMLCMHESEVPYLCGYAASAVIQKRTTLKHSKAVARHISRWQFELEQSSQAAPISYPELNQRSA